MNRFLYAFLLAPLSLLAADVKISDLPLKASVSTNTFLEVADMNAVTKSGKYLLTNLATVASVSGLGITNYHVAPGANITVATNVTGTNVTWTVGTSNNMTVGGILNAGSIVTPDLQVGSLMVSNLTTGLLYFDGLTVTNATPANITNSWGIFTGDTNSYLNGAGHLAPIYSTVTNYFLTNGANMTITTVTNGTNITATFAAANNVTNNLLAGTAQVSDLLVGALAVNRGTLTHAGGNVIVDFGHTNRYWSCILTGNVTFVLTNASAGKWANLLIFQTQATNCTPTFNLPAGTTNWFGGAPSTLTAGTVGSLSYYAISTDTNATLAAYAETQ